MKKGSKIAVVLTTIIAGSMIYGTEPADAKSIFSKIAERIDEVKIVFRGKNSNRNNNDYPHEPPRERMTHERDYAPPPPPPPDRRPTERHMPPPPPPPPHRGPRY